MRISRRTSGGRGEYEISEDHAGLTPTDLLDRQLLIDFGGGWIIDTGTILRAQGGKRRLRMEGGATVQLHRQVAAALLMPHPVRADEALGSGQPILKSDRYAIEHLECATVTLEGDARVRVTFSDIVLRNYNLHAESLGLAARLASVRRVWEKADELPPELHELLGAHEALVTTGDPLPKRAEELVAELETTLTELGPDLGIYRQGGEDVLRDLLQALDIAEVPPEPPVSVDDVDPQETELRRRTVREWKRWVATRGAASARFRRAVREAYGWTCLVTGQHLPRTKFNAVAGVDAAHILPWADYDLDEVSNGICLSKQAHWAFDEGLIVIRFDLESDRYVIELPDEVRDGLTDTGFSLEALEAWTGPIPEERLPAEAQLRPNPEYLEALYELYHSF